MAITTVRGRAVAEVVAGRVWIECPEEIHLPANAAAEPIPSSGMTAIRPGMTENAKAKNRRPVVAGAEGSAGRARPFAARSAGRIYGRPRLRAGHALRSGRAVGAREGSSVAPVSPFVSK